MYLCNSYEATQIVKVQNNSLEFKSLLKYPKYGSNWHQAVDIWWTIKRIEAYNVLPLLFCFYLKQKSLNKEILKFYHQISYSNKTVLFCGNVQ
jgi:hypothetical protein